MYGRKRNSIKFPFTDRESERTLRQIPENSAHYLPLSGSVGSTYKSYLVTMEIFFDDCNPETELCTHYHGEKIHLRDSASA